ncbi:MAG: ferritin-like domain-containing protein [Myxococcota bacterium]
MDGVGERLGLAIAAGLAMALGCGPTVTVSDGDSGGDGGNADDDTTGGAESVSATSGAGPTGAGDDEGTSNVSGSEGEAEGDDAEIKPDFGVPVPPPDPPRTECFAAPPDMPQCPVPLRGDEQLGYRCIPPLGAQGCDIAYEQVRDEASVCMGCNGFVLSVECGPITTADGQCCFWAVYTEGQSCPGRPFTVDGSSRVPRVVPRSDWSARVDPDVADLDEAMRQALARAWADEGCFEAASVASFSRFVLELIALGAPAALVADAQRAIGEEVGHARAFFGLASAYGARDVGPGALAVDDALATSTDPVAIAVALAREGCIGETISALQLGTAAARTVDPQVRTLLTAIADEELGHAELAWRALSWMLHRGDDEMRRHVAAVFRDADRFVPHGTSASDSLAPRAARAAGRLTLEERLELAERALGELVAPAAASLFAPWSVEASQQTAPRIG